LTGFRLIFCWFAADRTFAAPPANREKDTGLLPPDLQDFSYAKEDRLGEPYWPQTALAGSPCFARGHTVRQLRDEEERAGPSVTPSYNTPSLRTAVQLIDWDTGRQSWPQSQPSMASAFAAVMPAPDRRFSADWAKDSERRAAGQRAEQQRMVDYYARTTHISAHK
jgi:hypothetical protein